MKEEIQQQLHHQEDKGKLTFWKILGSILVIISGILPFLDNLIVWYNPEFANYENTIGGYVRNDYWLLSLYGTAIITSTGRLMKALPITYYFPIFSSVYCFILYILMFVLGIKFNPEWPHRIGFIIMLIPGSFILYRFTGYIKDLKLKDEMQSKTIDRIVQQNQMKPNENK